MEHKENGGKKETSHQRHQKTNKVQHVMWINVLIVHSMADEADDLLHHYEIDAAKNLLDLPLGSDGHDPDAPTMSLIDERLPIQELATPANSAGIVVMASTSTTTIADMKKEEENAHKKQQTIKDEKLKERAGCKRACEEDNTHDAPVARKKSRAAHLEETAYHLAEKQSNALEQHLAFMKQLLQQHTCIADHVVGAGNGDDDDDEGV